MCVILGNTVILCNTVIEKLCKATTQNCNSILPEEGTVDYIDIFSVHIFKINE